MRDRAWLSHAKGNGLDPRNPAAKDAWYRAELRVCLGVDTTKNSNTGRDFDLAMAHFESFIFGECYWNLRIMQGDSRRILHSIGEICAEHRIDDQDARAIAARLLKWEGHLDTLQQITDAKDLSKLRIALLKDARRKQKRIDQSAAAPADPAPRAPEIGTGLRAINPYFGAVEASFESPGVQARREAQEEGSRELRKLVRQQFAKDKRERTAAAHKAKAAAPTTVDEDNCPF